MKMLLSVFFVITAVLYGRVDCEYMARLQQQVIEEVCSKYDCSCCGTGGAAFYDVDRIFLSFQFDSIYSDVEFRILAINIANIFIDKINKNVLLRPYLRRYPAPISTISIDFLFPHKKGAICSGWMAAGKLVTYKDSGERLEYIDGINETYEEALQKVRMEADKNF
jgi:hypothetical protein